MHLCRCADDKCRCLGRYIYVVKIATCRHCTVMSLVNVVNFCHCVLFCGLQSVLCCARILLSNIWYWRIMHCFILC